MNFLYKLKYVFVDTKGYKFLEKGLGVTLEILAVDYGQIKDGHSLGFTYGQKYLSELSDCTFIPEKAGHKKRPAFLFKKLRPGYSPSHYKIFRFINSILNILCLFAPFVKYFLSKLVRIFDRHAV